MVGSRKPADPCTAVADGGSVNDSVDGTWLGAALPDGKGYGSLLGEALMVGIAELVPRNEWADGELETCCVDGNTLGTAIPG
mmetsp:Transcript_26725/g.40585  ORF Transcript_26725/g.40585 Transcript_26725/m.40585 type:complete len:82 (-) Transcript_26725:1124-1369(-)